MTYKFFALYMFAKECVKDPSFTDLPLNMRYAIANFIDVWEEEYGVA